MTAHSHRTIPAKNWLEACALVKAAREEMNEQELCAHIVDAPITAGRLEAISKKLHRIEQILMTSDPVATPHLGDDYEPETTCKRAMENMR